MPKPLNLMAGNALIAWRSAYELGFPGLRHLRPGCLDSVRGNQGFQIEILTRPPPAEQFAQWLIHPAPVAVAKTVFAVMIRALCSCTSLMVQADGRVCTASNQVKTEQEQCASF
jgi:hypothetical protein